MKIHFALQNIPCDNDYSHDLGKHGRFEERFVCLWRLSENVGHKSWHANFRVVVEVVRHTECFNGKKRCWEPRQEQPAYYLATCVDTAKTLGDYIRSHWGIENKLHHVLDRSLKEDASRIRKNPGIFATLRQFCCNLLRYKCNWKMNLKYYTLWSL